MVSKTELRKLYHVTLGLILASIVQIFSMQWAYIVLSVLLLVATAAAMSVELGYKIPIIWHMAMGISKEQERREAVVGYDAIMAIFGGLIAALIFPKIAVVVSLLMFAFADPTASIVGKKLGSTRIWTGKSLEGAFAAFLVALIVASPFFGVHKALYVSGMFALTELVIPKYDNFALVLFGAMFGYYIYLCNCLPKVANVVWQTMAINKYTKLQRIIWNLKI